MHEIQRHIREHKISPPPPPPPPYDGWPVRAKSSSNRGSSKAPSASSTVLAASRAYSTWAFSPTVTVAAVTRSDAVFARFSLFPECRAWRLARRFLRIEQTANWRCLAQRRVQGLHEYGSLCSAGVGSDLKQIPRKFEAFTREGGDGVHETPFVLQSMVQEVEAQNRSFGSGCGCQAVPDGKSSAQQIRIVHHDHDATHHDGGMWLQLLERGTDVHHDTRKCIRHAFRPIPQWDCNWRNAPCSRERPSALRDTLHKFATNVKVQIEGFLIGAATVSFPSNSPASGASSLSILASACEKVRKMRLFSIIFLPAPHHLPPHHLQCRLQ